LNGIVIQLGFSEMSLGPELRFSSRETETAAGMESIRSWAGR
jgi:hypothetical protein